MTRPRKSAKSPAAKRPRRAVPRAQPPEIAILLHDRRWLKAVPRLMTLTRRFARAALDATDAGPVAVTIVLAKDAEIRALNHQFRGKDKPTNVLSFPPAPGPEAADPEKLAEIGDVILAYETLAKEAVTQGKPFVNHLGHLVIHGILHLVGYDHERPGDARVMERLEAKILSMLGMPDPYGREKSRRG